MLFSLTTFFVSLALGMVPPEAAAKTTVLVELFTSEGCSSCPPADALLARFLKEQPLPDVDIVPLSLHVDYWDHQGWKDPFSSKAFTTRQGDYSKVFGADKIYTPQLVVDGRDELNGSDEAAAGASVDCGCGAPASAAAGLTRALVATSVRLSIDLPAAPADSRTHRRPGRVDRGRLDDRRAPWRERRPHAQPRRCRAHAANRSARSSARRSSPMVS